MLSNKNLMLIFAITALAYVLSSEFRPYPFHTLAKVIPIAVLFIFALKNLAGVMQKLTLTAIAFSALGDALLSVVFENHFLFGVGAFLIAQIFYAVIFFLNKNRCKLPSKLTLALGVIAYAIVMSGLILPEQATLKIAIVSYMTFISAMALTAIFAVRKSFLPVVGAFFFMASDSLIAWNMFKAPIPFSSLLIMSTYYIAQVVLLLGIVDLYKVDLNKNNQPSHATSH